MAATGLLLLAAGLQFSHRPPPVSFTVPIHDGEILVPPEIKVGLVAAPRSWPELPAPIRGGDDTASASDTGTGQLPEPPELAPGLAQGPYALVANRPPREAGGREGGAMPSMPVGDVAAETLPPPESALPPAPPPAPPPDPPVVERPPPAMSLARTAGTATPAMPPIAVAPPPPGAALPAVVAAPPALAAAPQRRDAPLVGIVLWGLGGSAEATEAAIARLPAEVTFGFTPYGRQLQEWADRALSEGHEVLLELPMEPRGYPAVDPGPDALLTALSADENGRRLQALLSRFSGYVGVTNLMGSRFTASVEHIRPVLVALRDRRLLFLDSRAGGDSVAYRIAGELGLARAVNNRYIDNEATAAAIDAQLAQLERAAQAQGSSVGLGTPSALTVERLNRWMPGLAAKGLRLAPLTAVADRGNAE